MKIEINIPNQVANRIFDAFADRYGWSAKTENGADNPETKEAFTKRMIIRIIKRTVKDVEAQKAVRKAEREATEKAESDIVIS